MKKRVLIALATLVTPLAALAQFEGVVEMKMTMTEGSGTGKVWVSKAGSRTEMEITGSHVQATGQASMKMTMLMKTADPDKVYNINDAKKTYWVMDLKKAREQMGKQKQDEDTYTVKKLGPGSVAGFSCQNALITSKRGTVMEGCFTKEILGGSAWLSQPGRGSRAGETGIIKAAKDAGVEGYPIRMVNKDKDGKVVSTVELVKAEKRSVPSSMFEVPAGYKESDMMSSMMSEDQQQKMKEAMDKMTPEQRKMMEEMMKKQGGGGH